MNTNIEPTIQKKGSVNKCPSCGAQLGAFVSACPSCGHEFTDVAANRTITALVERFDEIEREIEGKVLMFGQKRREKAILAKRSKVIRDFPIPNSREDLQQLLYFIQPKIAERVKPDPNVEDWRVKFQEVLSRAKNAYKNDSVMLAELQDIEKSLEISLVDNFAIKAKRNPVFFLLLFVIVALVLAGVVNWQWQKIEQRKCEAAYALTAEQEQARLETLRTAVDAALKSGNLTDASTRLTDFVWQVEDGACYMDKNAQAKDAWAKKKLGLAELIQKAQNEREAARAAEIAAQEAEAERILEEKKAELEKEAELARIAAAQERVRAAAQAEKQWRKERESKW